jgi:hypothetical protein
MASGNEHEHEHDFVLVPQSKMSSQGEMPEPFRMELCCGHDLQEISVDRLQHLFSTEALSSVDYTKFCLERIRKVRG